MRGLKKIIPVLGLKQTGPGNYSPHPCKNLSRWGSRLAWGGGAVRGSPVGGVGEGVTGAQSQSRRDLQEGRCLAP